MTQNEKDKKLILACEKGDWIEVSNALRAGGDPNAMGPISGAVHCAAFREHEHILKVLLKFGGVNVNVPNKQGYYPLQLAASINNIAGCTLLIKAGAQLEAKTEAGGTALHVAAASGFPKVINVLVKAGADIEAVDNEGNTPLCTAAALGKTNSAATLIKLGANIEAENIRKERPLIIALNNLYSKRIEGWISEGENEGIPVRYQLVKGCFLYTKGDKTKILSLKDQRYCASKDWGPKGHIYYVDALETVLELLKSKPQLDAADNNPNTPIHIACHCGEAKVIDAMAPMVKDINIVNWRKATPLHMVSGSGRLDGLQSFLKAFTIQDINVKDANGWTPLHWLADIGGDLKMAELLLKQGADRNVKSTADMGEGTPAGVTPAQVALHWNDQAMAQILTP